MLIAEKSTTSIALYMIRHDLSALDKCHLCYCSVCYDFPSLFSIVGVLTNQKTECTNKDDTVSSLYLEVIELTEWSMYITGGTRFKRVRLFLLPSSVICNIEEQRKAGA